jgi:hypothetical protein
MKTRHKVPEVGKEPPESALEDQGEEEVLEGQEDQGEQLVISVQHDVNDPNTIVLVRKRRNKFIFLYRHTLVIAQV